jgi:aryl-phospho-beta-D-glucosidase BglC (GH1 family)
MDEAIKWSKKYGVYVIIDWHSEGNLVTGKFLTPLEEYQTTKEETKSFWKSVAGRYKNEPAAAFYEIFNEPAALSWIGDRLDWSD